MDVAPARDWVIIILGILEIIFIIGLITVLIILYTKINRVVTKGKETVQKIEHAVVSPYFTAGSWVFKIIATGLGMLQKRRAKGE